MEKMTKRRRERFLQPLVGVVIALATLTGALPTIASAENQPVKRLKRLNPNWMGGEIDDSYCTRERAYREEDYLAAMPDKDIANYQAMADKGDVEAMYLLSKIARETPDGGREYPYRETWLPLAEKAGHPIALYERAREESFRQGQAKGIIRPFSDNALIELAEKAAMAQGSGEIAARLAVAYRIGDGRPEIPKELQHEIKESDLFREGDSSRPAATTIRVRLRNPQKAVYWARIAAEKGNILVAERLCTDYSWGNPSFAVDGQPVDNDQDGVRWCVLAAQAPCLRSGALYLSGLYKEGKGVPRSFVDAAYWEEVDKQRSKRPNRNWEYTEE